MLNKLKSLFTETKVKPNQSAKLNKPPVGNYSPLLELLPDYSTRVECMYQHEEPPWCRVIEITLKLEENEYKSICSFGDLEVSKEACDACENILSREVGGTISNFYQDNIGNVIVFYPLDVDRYRGYISNGFYLTLFEGEFKLSCRYRVLKEIS